MKFTKFTRCDPHEKILSRTECNPHEKKILLRCDPHEKNFFVESNRMTTVRMKKFFCCKNFVSKNFCCDPHEKFF